MKSEKTSPAEKTADLKALRRQIVQAKAEASRTAAAARDAKAQMKKAKKAAKQARKAAKHCRKELKALLAAQAAAAPAKSKKAHPARVKQFVPRNASVIASLPPEPSVAPVSVPAEPSPATDEAGTSPPATGTPV